MNSNTATSSQNKMNCDNIINNRKKIFCYGIMLPSICEKHKICLNRTKSLLVVN